MNTLFTVVFCVEMVFKLIGLGPRKYSRDKINYLDGAVVILRFDRTWIFQRRIFADCV